MDLINSWHAVDCTFSNKITDVNVKTRGLIYVFLFTFVIERVLLIVAVQIENKLWLAFIFNENVVRNLLHLNIIQITIRNDTLTFFVWFGVESHSYTALNRLDGFPLSKRRYDVRHHIDNIKVQRGLCCYITVFLVPFFLYTLHTA